jgi:hypothetical protein
MTKRDKQSFGKETYAKAATRRPRKIQKNNPKIIVSEKTEGCTVLTGLLWLRIRVKIQAHWWGEGGWGGCDCEAICNSFSIFKNSKSHFINRPTTAK